MPGISFELVVDDEKAADLRKNSEDRLKGVFVLNTVSCRGYDMKLGEDARVLIISGSKGFPLSYVKQMVGKDTGHLFK